jgi:hypothetical protein
VIRAKVINIAATSPKRRKTMTKKKQRCTECGQKIKTNHLSECGKRVAGCNEVFEEDCTDEEETPFDIKKWINAELKEARKGLKEADKARDKSDYTDIDALEQYCYNEGVIDTLVKLRGLLR